MIRKLQSNKGETLIEAMVSLVIAVLAMGLVVTATMAATNINKSTKDADKTFAEDLQAAEIYSETPVSKTLQIKVTDGPFLTETEGGSEQITVDVYGAGSNFASYK